jgi:hypothetical protein
METEIRVVFHETVDAVRPLLAQGALRERWETPSALALMSTGALAGHLLRATALVDSYLDRPEPDISTASIIRPAQYLAQALTDDDLHSALHQSIRQRGEEMAAGGADAVLDRWDATATTLRQRLEAEPAERMVSVLDGMVLTLDDYLRTRVLEMCVHSDDLAVSLDVPTPQLPDQAVDVGVEILMEVARIRHGRLAVIRALARRERDPVQALRVL